MNSSNQGLTVGELTVTIGVLIIAVLIWSNVTKKQDPKQSSISSYSQISLPHKLHM